MEPQIVSEGTRHAVVDAEGLVVNVIIAPPDFDPGDGLTLLPLDEDSPAGPGDTIKRGKLTRAEPAPPEPTLEDRIAALEAKAER